MTYLNSANSIQSNGRPETVMSLIDLSPSMDFKDWKPNRLAGAIKANTKLMEIKAARHPQDRMGLVGFWSKAQTLHPPVQPSRSLRSLKNALENANGGWGTNFTAALEQAEKYLFNGSGIPSGGLFSKMLMDIFCETEQFESGKTDAKFLKRIILLTDGDHNQGGNPLRAANRLKNAGVVIDCIGIGGSPGDVNETLLKQIASRNPDGSARYWFIGDQEKLIKTYETLARHIQVI